MGLDIRLPLGLLFLATGALMTAYGLFTRGSVIYEKSLSMNINLIWGLVLLLFGLAMLLLSWTARRRLSRTAPDVPSNSEAPLHRTPRSH